MSNKIKTLIILAIISSTFLIGCGPPKLKPDGATSVEIVLYSEGTVTETIIAANYSRISERTLTIILEDGTEVTYSGNYKVTPIYE